MASNSIVRFGRRVLIPSKVQVLHDYRVFAEERDVRERCATEEGLPLTASWVEIIVHRSNAASAAAAATKT
jgi:hypothetical protein